MNLKTPAFVTFLLVFFGLGAWSISHSQVVRRVRLFHPRYPDLQRTTAALQTTHLNSSTHQPPIAVVVGHHLLAADLFRDTLVKIPSAPIQHVILFAPNHFLAGQGRIQTLNQDFATPYGRLVVNHGLIRQLTDQNLATIEPSTFIGEHGIANLLPFIKKLFPNADVTPIVVWPGLSIKRLTPLRDFLASASPENTLLLGSFDFSHYVPSAQAIQQDHLTLAELHAMRLNRLPEMAVDSPDGLWLFVATAKSRGAQHFLLDQATNSGVLTKARAETPVTSYITGQFTR